MLSMCVMCYVVIVTKPVHRSQIRDRNSAQLGGTPTIPPSYVRVRAAVWACGRGQTDRQTDRHTHTHTHTDVRDHYTFRVVYDSREM